VQVIDRKGNFGKLWTSNRTNNWGPEVAAPAQLGRKARFSFYSFDLKTGDLTRDGIRLRLEVQPARVLELLIVAEGDLVSRADLISTLWPGEVEGNFGRRLDKAVAKLRASLNDDPAKPRYIETLKGRGYRFLVKVGWEPLDSGVSSAAPAPETPSVQPIAVRWDFEEPVELFRPRTVKPAVRFRWVSALAALMLAASALTFWFKTRPYPRPPRAPVVLILGFRDASTSPGDVWISHSVAEWLATDLDAGGELQLISAENNPELRARSSEEGCGKLPRSVVDAARRAFGADRVIYGDYSESDDAISGDRWHLDVCLEDTRSRNTPESMTVVGAKGDIAQLVFSAGDLLRSKLGLKQLSSQSLGFLRATLPSNLDAARLYAEGTSALEHFEPEEASALLAQAVQLEPQHAPTHAALSSAWAALGYQQRGRQEAILARDFAKSLSPTQQLEYEGLAYEATDSWAAAVDVFGKLFQRFPDSIGYGLKLANAQTNAAKGQLALDTVRTLRSRNGAAATDPRVDLAEAAADSALSDFTGQLAASTQAENHAGTQGADLLVADGRMSQANADDALGNWAEALRLWRLAGQSYESVGDRDGMADALNHQADLAWKKGDPTNARKLFEESITLSRTTGDNTRLAYSLSRLGIVRMSVDRAPGGEMPEAVEMYRQAASIYHKIGNTAEEGYVLSLLGDEAMQRTKFEEARAFYFKAMALSQAANDKSRVAGRLLDLGIVAAAEGHNPEAIQFDRQSSQAYEELGQKDRAAIARIRLGVSLFRSGKVLDAEEMLQDSLAVMRSFGRLNQVREVLGDLTKVEILVNPAAAEALARENLKLNQQLLAPDVCCSPSFALVGETLLAQGKLREANDLIRQAFAPNNVLSVEGLPEVLLTRGNIRTNQNDYSGANADFERALQMAHARGDRYFELDARLGLAELHVCQKGAGAKPELDRVKHDADQLGYGIFAIKIDTFLHYHRPAP
jgi:DNA-binding winged helix-turn-helix (wHTH) protein/tetratricopeptide (TPR) repeat protein